jgi:hypothetical protein
MARNGMRKTFKVCCTLITYKNKSLPSPSGLSRAKQALLTQLNDLQKSKPRGNTDQNLISEIARIESALTIARDDLVRTTICSLLGVVVLMFSHSECRQASLEWS